ncbi:hypothetical protein LUW77_15010 [Streptomyces radiopugnans]|nr:hypothetical protein LUW77_15010 [Streptomyces radiopugnans]
MPQLGRLRLRDLRPSHVDRLLTALDNGKRKAATIRRVHATLRSALSTAVRRRLVTFNAAKDVELPRTQRPKAQPWELSRAGRVPRPHRHAPPRCTVRGHRRYRDAPR